jgi:hypothetical protein
MLRRGFSTKVRVRNCNDPPHPKVLDFTRTRIKITDGTPRASFCDHVPKLFSIGVCLGLDEMDAFFNDHFVAIALSIGIAGQDVYREPHPKSLSAL